MTENRAMRDALLENIWEQMSFDKKIFFVTADFGSPVLDKIRADFPERFINVGIAEQNLINISSGLSLEGYKVFAYAIAPFITMRCFEQLRVNLALMHKVRNINVNLIGVGAGYSYVVSGPTHQCYEDIGLIRNLPNFELYSPSDQHSAGALVELCLKNIGPKYLRLDAQPLEALRRGLSSTTLNNGFEILRNGGDGAIISTGYMTHTALHAAKYLSSKIDLSVIDIFNLTSFDRIKLSSLIKNFRYMFTAEEGFVERGGLDAVIAALIRQKNLNCNFEPIGVAPNYRFELGNRNELHRLVGIDKHTVCSKIKKAYDMFKVAL
jgi:transketolase